METYTELDNFLNELEKALQVLLIDVPDTQAISEYTLLRLLSAPPFSLFETDALQHLESLFTAHFSLFHCLYRLQDRVWKEMRRHLEISALRIVLHPKGVESVLVAEKAPPVTGHPSDCPNAQLAAMDPLKTYYLDLKHLHTRPEEIAYMLNRFWVRLMGKEEKQAEALAVLGCSVQDNLATIRKAYRRLASLHHPDKGGEETTFIKIRQAYEALTGQT